MVQLEETPDEHFRRAPTDAEEWEDEEDGGSDVVCAVMHLRSAAAADQRLTCFALTCPVSELGRRLG